MSEENVELVRHAYEAWNRGDLEWLLNHTTPASEFRTAPLFPDAEALYQGQEGFTFADWDQALEAAGLSE